MIIKKRLALITWLLVFVGHHQVWAFSWQTTTPSISHPNAIHKDAFGQSVSNSNQFDVNAAFIEDWDQSLMMYLSGNRIENNSAVDPSFNISGSSQNTYLSPPNNWAFYYNQTPWLAPLTLAPQPWQSPILAWVGVNMVKQTTFLPAPNGTLLIDGQRGNSNDEKEVSFKYDSHASQNYALWWSQINQPNGFAVFLQHDIDDGDREQTNGNANKIGFLYTQQTPQKAEHFFLQRFHNHANYNQTIPLELYQVSNLAYYVGPNVSDETTYRAGWQGLQMLSDRTRLFTAIYADDHQLTQTTTHPLNLSTACSDFSSNQLCFRGQALMTTNDATINPSDIGSPRSYALDSQPDLSSRGLTVDQHVEHHSQAQKYQWGLHLMLADVDYREQFYLAQLNQDRMANDVLNSGQKVSLGGLKSDTNAASQRANLSPIDITHRSIDTSLYGQNRWQLSPLTQLSVLLDWHHTFYDAKNNDQQSLFSGVSLDASEHFQSLNPSLGVTHSLSNNNFVFANIYQVNRPPSPKLIACSDSTNPCFWPGGYYNSGDLDQAIDYGLVMGYKQNLWHVVEGFSWAVTGSWQRHKDDIILVPTDWMQGYATNIDRTERLAANMDMHWMQDKWRIDGLYEIQDAFYASHFSVGNAYDSGSQNVSPGDPLPGLPRHQLRLNVGYQWLPSFTLQASWLGISEATYYGNFTGDQTSQEGGQWQLTQLPGYGIVNTLVAWHPTYQINVNFNINNIFDKHYLTSGTFGLAPDSAYVPMTELGDTGSGTIVGIDDPRFVMPGQERTWSIKVAIAF